MDLQSITSLQQRRNSSSPTTMESLIIHYMEIWATQRLVLQAGLDKASEILVFTFFSSTWPVLRVVVTWVVQMSAFYYEVQIYVVITLLFIIYVTTPDRSVAKHMGLSESWHLQSGFWKYFSLTPLNAHQNLIPLFCQHVGLLPHPPAWYQFIFWHR